MRIIKMTRIASLPSMPSIEHSTFAILNILMCRAKALIHEMTMTMLTIRYLFSSYFFFSISLLSIFLLSSGRYPWMMLAGFVEAKACTGAVRVSVSFYHDTLIPQLEPCFPCVLFVVSISVTSSDTCNGKRALASFCCLFSGSCR